MSGQDYVWEQVVAISGDTDTLTVGASRQSFGEVASISLGDVVGVGGRGFGAMVDLPTLRSIDEVLGEALHVELTAPGTDTYALGAALIKVQGGPDVVTVTLVVEQANRRESVTVNRGLLRVALGAALDHLVAEVTT